MDHPSFLLWLDLKRGDGGSLPGNGPFSLSESAGTVSALPGENGLFLNGGTSPNNTSGLSSTAGIRRNSPYTNDTGFQQPTNNMTSNLQTVRSHDKNRSPCWASNCLRGSASKPEVPASGFSLSF